MEAQTHRGILQLEYPVRRGIVHDWHGYEQLLDHVYESELRVPSKDYPILFTESVLAPVQQREKVAELLFEKYGVPALYFASPAVMSLMSSGRTTGLGVQVGAGVTTVVPVWEGFALGDGVRRWDLGGDDVTQRLRFLLCEMQGKHFSTTADLEIVQDMKEKFAFVVDNIQKKEHEWEMGRWDPPASGYLLPDGQEITLSHEQYHSGEIMFQPSLAGGHLKNVPGIHHMIWDSILACSVDTRRDLYSNIVCAGGATMLKGFPERLVEEVRVLAEGRGKSRVVITPERRYAAWIGGSIVASMSNFENVWLSRDVYEESGRCVGNLFYSGREP